MSSIDERLLAQLKDDSEEMPLYQPDAAVWHNVQKTLPNTPQKKYIFNRLKWPAVAASILVGLLFVDKSENRQGPQLASLIETSQRLEQQANSTVLNFGVKESMRWQLVGIEQAINSEQESAMVMDLWQQRINVLNDALALSRRTGDFI